VKLVKVDCTAEEKLAERFEVRGYPTIRFFRDGVDSEYSGGRTADEIVAWVNKKSGPPAVDIDTVDAAKELAESEDVVFFGFFDSKTGAEATTFLQAAGASDHVFGISTNADVAKAYGVAAPAIVALRTFDEPQVNFEGKFDSVDAIVDFANAESLPLVIEFTNENAPRIFGGQVQVHCLIFVEKDTDAFEGIISAARGTAKNFRGEILFVHVDSAQDDNMRILEYFGLSEEDLPAVRLIDLENNMAKYQLDGDITQDALTSFCQKFQAGTLEVW